VVFPALDARVKNVATAYTLEHQIESNLFDELSGMLALLGERDSLDASSSRSLAGCSEALSTVLAQHLAKEEEHVSSLNSGNHGCTRCSTDVTPLETSGFPFADLLGACWPALQVN